MLNKQRLAMSVVAFAVLSASHLSMAATTVTGGTVHFTGRIVNAACAVSADSTGQTVNMGQYRTAFFDAKGKKSGNVPFSIKLVDCDTTIVKTAKFAFSGPRDQTDTTLLRVHSGPSTNAVTASGVGIEISDSAGTVVTPDGAAFSKAETIIDGNNTINFIARYKSTAAAVTAGQAYADANFVVSYQ